MPFESLVGHAAAKERLAAVVAAGRVAGSWLFAGPEGLGKRAIAEEFLRLAGAEVSVLGREEGKRDIAVERVRELLRVLSFKSAGAIRGILVDDADCLNAEGQNALLKTLEEPPGRCVFVLVSASPALLLPTILSRCHTVLFAPLNDKELAATMKPLGLDAGTAAWIAALSGGSPGRAKELAGRAADVAALATEVLGALASGELNPVIEHLGKIRDTSEARERGRDILRLAILALREALRARETGRTPDLRLLPAPLAKRLEALDGEDLADRIRIALDRVSAIDRNANVGLAVEDALLRV